MLFVILLLSVEGGMGVVRVGSGSQDITMLFLQVKL